MAPYHEHRLPRGEWSLYAREYPGEAPAFVLMHGFPDNVQIYDARALALGAAGRRTIAFDFLGYGASDTPASHDSSLEGLEADLDAVVPGLRLRAVVLVAHDASGPTALNWALEHQPLIAGIGLLNTYYEPTAHLRFPELISVFADPLYADRCAAIAAEPAQLTWLFGFQGKRFCRDAPAEVRDRSPVILPIVQRQFAGRPSVLPTFIGLTRGLYPNLERNAKRIERLAELPCPISIIWGTFDPFLTAGVAKHVQELFSAARLTPLPLGHWPQVDGAELVARELLGL